jgi:hypothetical protein
LRDDQYGFAAWVRKNGVGAWLRYVLQHPVGVFADFRTGYAAIQEQGRMLSFGCVFSGCPPSAFRARLEQHLDVERSHAPDAIRLIQRWILRPPLRDVLLQILMVVAGMVLIFLLRRRPMSPTLEAWVILVMASIFMSFLSFYGDGMEHERHLGPPYLLYCIGVLLTLASCAAFLIGLAMASMFTRMKNLITRGLLGVSQVQEIPGENVPHSRHCADDIEDHENDSVADRNHDMKWVFQHPIWSGLGFEALLVTLGP